MDIKLLYVRAITLLYRESELEETSRSYDLVRNTMMVVPVQTGVVTSDLGRSTVDALRDTLDWMVGCDPHYEFNKKELLQRLRVNSGRDIELFEAVKDGINEVIPEDELKKLCGRYRRELGMFYNEQSVKAIIKEAYIHLQYDKGQKAPIDIRKFVPELQDKLAPYAKLNAGITEHASFVNRFLLDDTSAVSAVMLRAREELSYEGIIKFGLQGINRMFGDQGGARRGEMLLITAMSNCYKSGLCLDLFRWHALYNTPKMRDPKKVPLLLHLSFENPVEMNMCTLFATLKGNETGEKVDPKTMDPAEVSTYVRDRLQETGYKIMMTQIDPSNFTWADLHEFLLSLEAEGYEIHGAYFDYLNMMSKRGLAQGVAGVDIRDLFKRVRNWGAPRGVFMCTPHQISSEGKMLLRQFDATDVVNQIAGKGYYDQCKTLETEVDIEIILHLIGLPGNQFYLAYRRGKHRKYGYSQQNVLSGFYQMDPVCGLKDDINGKDSVRRKISSNTAGDGGGDAWGDTYDVAA